MNESKTAIQSKSVWGMGLAGLIMFAQALGFELDAETRQTILTNFEDLIAAICALFGVYGRLTATQRIEGIVTKQKVKTNEIPT